MYNATSTSMSENEDDLETYQFWLERQLLSRLEKIDELEKTQTEEIKKLESILWYIEETLSHTDMLKLVNPLREAKAKTKDLIQHLKNLNK